MCGRVVIPDHDDIVKELRLLRRSKVGLEVNINTSPTQFVPAITDDQINSYDYLQWSLVPSYSQTGKPDQKYQTFNAKIENMETSGIWKRLIGRRHCVVITEGFYEWNYDDPVKKKGSHPHLIRTKGERFTFMAGLWDVWRNPVTQERLYSCTIITQPANEMMAAIHNTKARMPAILTPDLYKIWLDPELPFKERKQAIISYDNDFLQAVEIKKVGDLEEYKQVTVC